MVSFVYLLRYFLLLYQSYFSFSLLFVMLFMDAISSNNYILVKLSKSLFFLYHPKKYTYISNA